MKELKVAKLGEEELAMFEEMESLKGKLDILMAVFASKKMTLWENLTEKYLLSRLKIHYVRDGSIYTQT